MNLVLPNDTLLDVKGLLDEIAGLGVSIVAFSKLSKLSFKTLKRIHAGLPVQAHNIGKARMALAEIRSQESVPKAAKG